MKTDSVGSPKIGRFDLTFLKKLRNFEKNEKKKNRAINQKTN
jgi:hypothetical protein